MLLINAFDIAIPLTNPVLKFLVILLIILLAPILLNKIKIPHILGLIIAGAVIGPFGFNLITRDSSIILSGTAGLLYIMFLAGLEIDMADFKKNAFKSTLLGLYGFVIPMILGTLTGLYLLKYPPITSVLMASMFASHTLITYPIVSKLGVSKNRAVNISVGSTLITNILALFVLAIIVGMTSEDIAQYFMLRLTASFVIFSTIIMVLFPLIARWFFKRFDDSVSQYVFVLVMVFLGAVLSEIAGIEGIIGAFLAGLALNRLIPRTSPLMNRINFVGNAIFIPFFLLGVGMLIDYRAFFTNPETFTVAAAMSIVATAGKFLPSLLVQKSFRYLADERRLIFGLTNAQAAATLAAVLIGYNIILGETSQGEPIRLLNESILNGTIIMILVTCTIASFATQKGARAVARMENEDTGNEDQKEVEKILIPVNNPETVDELIHLSAIIKSKRNKRNLFALQVVNNNTSDPKDNKKARKLLEKAAITASSADIHLTELLRYDLNIVNAITSVVMENEITDLVMGLHIKKGISESFLGDLTEGILKKCNVTSFVYKSAQPISTVKRHFIIIPENAEQEIGFPFWLLKIWNIGENTGAKLLFYGTKQSLGTIRDIHSKHPIEASFHIFGDWDDFLILSREIKADDNLIIVLSREHKPSYHKAMANIPNYLNKYFHSNSFILIYPIQTSVAFSKQVNLNYPSLQVPVEKLDEIGKTIAGLFKRK
jgi:Kef-type K+ transport system membrane component KefB/nucleotide-binding universal stress UspA family protein